MTPRVLPPNVLTARGCGFWWVGESPAHIAVRSGRHSAWPVRLFRSHTYTVRVRIDSIMTVPITSIYTV